MTRPSAMVRRYLSLVLALLCVVFFEARGYAQDEGGAGDNRVSMTSVFIPEGQVQTSDLTWLQVGLRRGLRNVGGVGYVTASDVLSGQEPPEDLAPAVEQLDNVAAMVRANDLGGASRTLEGTIDLIENNLLFVKRATLADAYMLRALIHCKKGERDACVDGFRDVLAFRDQFEYDPVRYPEEFARSFNDVRLDLENVGRLPLQVTTDPTGAEVFIDGRSFGPSPISAEGLLPGPHYVTVKAQGRERVMRRVELRARRGIETLRINAPESPRARILEDNVPRIRDELGRDRAGDFIVGIAAYLYVNQVVVGTVRPSRGGYEVDAYLYDLRTRFLLAHRTKTVSTGGDMAAAGTELIRDLYQGVDLSGAVAAPPEAERHHKSTPLYERWWFWSAIGVVVASGVVAAVVASDTDQSVPDGYTRATGIFITTQ